MKDKIKFFVKFGNKKHMNRLLKGKMYFSNANRFREIEYERGEKGQGDAYEGILRLENGKLIIKNKEKSREILCENVNTKIDFAQTCNIPVFCITYITADDYSICTESDKKCILKIHDGIKNKIKSDFPKADTVCIFYQPEQFLSKLNSLGVYKNDRVHYFDLNSYEFVEYIGSNYGAESNKNKIALSGSIKTEGESERQWKITEQNLYRILFCKDKFFENEKEYRIILPNKQIYKPKEFSIKWGNQKRAIMPLDVFFEGIEL